MSTTEGPRINNRSIWGPPAAQRIGNPDGSLISARTLSGLVLVVDTSAVLEALAALDPDPALIARLGDDGDLHGPHLIDVEVLHALRRMTMRGEISDERAMDARTDFSELTLVRYPHHPLSDRVWELRHNLSAYEATFIALAEALAAPLVSCDARLASAPGHAAHVELFAAS